MDKLQFIIHSLNEEEKKGFEFFVNRFRFREERLDVKLFKRLSKPEKLDLAEAFEILYAGANEKEAYHALRKRLLGHLVEYVSVKKINTENGNRHYSSRGLITLAEYLFSENAPIPAWQYFNRAYASEVKKENYDVLAVIYLMWLENWATYTGNEDFTSVYKRYLIIKQNLEKAEALRLSLSLIQRKFQQQKLLQQGLSVDDLLKDAIEGMSLKKKDFLSTTILPSLLSTLMGCCKEKQDFDAVLKFVNSRIKKLTKKVGVGDELQLLQNYQLQLLIKAGNFEGALKNQCFVSEKELNIQLKSKVLLGTGQFASAAKFIKAESTKNKPQVTFLLELLTSLIASDKFTEANNVLNAVKHSQAWLSKKMGAEWSCNYQLVLILIELQKNNVPQVLRLLKVLLTEIKQLEVFIDYYKNLYDVLIVMQRELKANSELGLKRTFNDLSINVYNPNYLQAAFFVAFFTSKYSGMSLSASLNEIINQFN